jgi:hypothetical protein
MKIPKFTKLKLKKPSGVSTDLKPPKAVADLYADLRDRRLLPLVALLAIAIVAVPFLLADKSPTKPAFVPASPGAAPAAATFSVVPAKQQLRDYRKRLKHRKRESPFSLYAAARVSNETREQVEEVVDTVENGGAVAPETTETGGTETSPPVEEAAPSQPPVKATIKANVGVAAVIKAGFVGSEPKQSEIPSQTRLPKPETPVVVYTGPSKDGTGAVFLMSNSVTAYYGKGRCVLGGEICQELELQPGKSATFAVGYGETRYKVTLLGFKPVVKEATIERGN